MKILKALTAIIAKYGENYMAEEGTDEAVCESVAKEIMEAHPELIELPHDYKLVSMRPYSMRPVDAHLLIVLAQSANDGKFATWTYNKQDRGCSHGNYFNKEQQEKAFGDFLLRGDPTFFPACLSYGDFRTELGRMPQTMYPDLIRALVEAAYNKDVFKDGGASRLIGKVEKDLGKAK